MHNNASSELFDLIHSMDKGEKRYFKLYVRARSPHIRDINYLQLFDVIERQKEYNEEKIVRKDIVKKKHLRILKHYLHNLILESLRALRNKGDNVTSKLKSLLENALILQDKGLEDEELKFLIKAKELALRHEKWGAVLEALFGEIKIMRRRSEFKKQRELEREVAELLIKLDNVLEYIRINRAVFAQVQKLGKQRTDGIEDRTFKKIINHPYLRDVNKGLTIESKKLYYHACTCYYWFTGDYQTAHSTLLEGMQLMESNYSILGNQDISYSSDLNLLTFLQCQLGKYPEALSTIKKHRTLLEKEGAVQTHAFIYSYLNEANYFLFTNQFEKGVAILKDIEKELDEHKYEVYYLAVNALYYNIASLYFGVADYHKALIWINKILNRPKTLLQEDTQTFARILQILVCYELNTPDIMENLIISAYRFLLRRKRLFKVEEGMLRFIRRLGKTDASQNALFKEFSRFRDELLEITQDLKEKQALQYFDLISWLESKIEKRPFAEILREKAAFTAKGK